MSEDLQTVVVVDDDAPFRRALQRLLQAVGYRVEALASATEFLERDRPDGPVCLVLDLAMPGMDGLALQSRLSALEWEPSIVFLTGHGEVRSSVQAMKGGAVDFLTKPADEADLLDAIATGLSRHRQVLAETAQTANAIGRLSSLTQREREVAALVVAGQRNKQIAFALGIAEKTAKVHRGRVMHKVGVRSVAELVRLWELARSPDEAGGC